MTVILPDFNLQTRPKMRTRFAISSSTDTNKRILLMTWSWLSREIGTIYRPDSKWGPDLASQVLQALFTLPDVLGWQKNFINDVILNFTRPGWNFRQSQNEDRMSCFKLQEVLKIRFVGHQVYTILIGIFKITLLL